MPTHNVVGTRTYVADTPCHSALLTRSRSLIRLTVDAKVHDVISADGAVVYHDIPRPQGNSVPLFEMSDRSGREYLPDAEPLTFFTSNLFLSPRSPALTPTLLVFTFGAAPASVISTSAIVLFLPVKASRGFATPDAY